MTQKESALHEFVIRLEVASKQLTEVMSIYDLVPELGALMPKETLQEPLKMLGRAHGTYLYSLASCYEDFQRYADILDQADPDGDAYEAALEEIVYMEDAGAALIYVRLKSGNVQPWLFRALDAMSFNRDDHSDPEGDQKGGWMALIEQRLGIPATA